MAETSSSATGLEGKTCLITGGTSGIGSMTALGLAQRGARVILVGRSPERCEATVASIREEANNPAVEAVVADLSSQAEVRRLAEDVRVRTLRLDVLVNNAGAAFLDRRESIDGIEMTWALNHLAYFLLTNLLLDALKAGAPARVVSVASDAHKSAKGIDFEDVEGKKRYRPFRAYAQSKLANILFTTELARRLEGSGVTANALHPGFVATRFFEGERWIHRVVGLSARLFALSPEAGARTPIYLAASPDVARVTGGYFVRQKQVTPSPAARDPDAARRLWRLSEEMTGLPVSA
jgi:NAD(P)-dependent dehydrogenase (short-subunit alcohol dehydrogenase family)